MKKNYIICSAFLAMLYFTLSSDVDGAAHHGHGNVTGSATGTVGHCQTSGCHGGNNALTIVQIQVLDTITMLPITVYNAAQTYLVTITGNDTAVTASLPAFGFQASAVLGNHTQAGTYTIPASLASSIHTFPCGATTVVEQSTPLAPVTAGVNKYAIQFYWTAPTTFSDSVTWYALLNAVNGNGGSSGDYPNEAPRLTIHENPTDAVAAINAIENAFSVYPNPGSVSPTVSYNLASEQRVSISVCDITGRTVIILAENEFQHAGTHQYTPTITTPGLYFISLVSGNFRITHQFVKL